MTLDERHSLWAECDALAMLEELRSAYSSGDLVAKLYGDEMKHRLAAAYLSSIRQACREYSCAAQGMEARLRRAEDMLPPDWKSQRFANIVGS